jgi:acyl-CoA dehydrogenase
VADKILLLARTTPLEEVRKPTDGLSLFYTDFDRTRIEVHEIEKMGRKAVDSNELFFDGLRDPGRRPHRRGGARLRVHPARHEPRACADRRRGRGPRQPGAARATAYAKERIVFNRPIGQNQGIQHPLAQNWMELEAANLMVMKAAWLYDNGLPCGAEPTPPSTWRGEAGFNACQQAVMTHGGFGYAKEYHVERYLREVLIPRIAPISPQLVLSYIAERVLGLPKSY